jgi:SynChlorMet cassette radical SAM/SPASM protein ScmE
MKVMNSPESLDLSITNRCNLRCRYCSHFKSAGDVSRDLPKEEWLSFFKELNSCKVMSVTIEGGEPFVREDLQDIIACVVENRMRFRILSNGTLITDEMAAFIARTGRCNSVQVSIDGSMPATHDSFRGEGSFQKAVQGIKRLKKYQVPIDVRVTIHKHNVRDLGKIARLLLDELGLPGFSTNAASHMGLCRYHADEVQLGVDERLQAMESLLTLNKKYSRRISASAGPLAEAVKWIEMERLRGDGGGAIPGGGYLTGCGGVMSKMAVRSDGIMVPCIQMSHIILGRINQDNIMQVWQHHPELIRLRERSKIPLRDFLYCRECEYIDYCTGNCPALSYTVLGEENHPSLDGCLKRFLEMGGELPRISQEQLTVLR